MHLRSLQGEIWLQFVRRSGTGFSSIYYFQGATKAFLVDMARNAATNCYAPKEALNQPSTMYMVRNEGYVGVRGKLFSQGKFW